MKNTAIEWTDVTWNPTTGCNKVSQGCKFCYAEVMTRRLKAMGIQKYEGGFKEVRLHRSTLALPYSWSGSKNVFVNSMSDLFHDEVPLEFIADVFSVMRECPQHRFQVLTKRSERLEQCRGMLEWPENVWMGVSVENSNVLHRIDSLRTVPSAVRFLSLEPLIGPLNGLDLAGIDWVIVGGESGPKARPMDPDWVYHILELCQEGGIPFFFKQWGGPNKKRAGRLLDGRTWDEMPRRLQAIGCSAT